MQPKALKKMMYAKIYTPIDIKTFSIPIQYMQSPETKLRQIAPLAKGRPKKNKTIEDYEKENKRLRMEVALMRDFLQSTERK